MLRSQTKSTLALTTIINVFLSQLKEQLIKALSRLVNADEQIESLQRKAELLKSDLARAESGVNKLQTQVAENVETLQ